MTDVHFLARDVLKDIRPYIPGKPIEEVAREIGIDPDDIIKLASNENPLGPSPKAVKALKEAIDEVNLYPDDGAYYLKRKLSEKFGVDPEQIMVANGSVELIQLLGLAFLSPNDSLVTSAQSFIMYRIVGKIIGAEVIETPLTQDYKVDLDAILKAIKKNTKLVFISNPNNPTGTANLKDEVERFMERVPEHVIVVWDEAYYEYVADGDWPDTIKYLKSGMNVVALRTMSKAYGLAGLRIGYGFTTPEIVSALMKVRLPFNVNRLAQIAAAAALDDEEHVRRSRELVEKEREFFYREFERLGLRYCKTYANFVFVELGIDGYEVYEQLLHKGIIVRPLRAYNFPTAVRITIGTHEQNVRLINELEKILKEKKVGIYGTS